MNRTVILNHLAEANRLTRYLEIGVQTHVNFEKVKCAYKVSVDPDPAARATFEMTSDEFFAFQALPEAEFDLIFIDGMHEAMQVERDFRNAMARLSKRGFIVLHDCSPEKEEFTHVPRDSKIWNGDVYRFAASLDLEKYTVDVDHGCMVVPWARNYVARKPFIGSWKLFCDNRKSLLNLISWDEFMGQFLES